MSAYVVNSDLIDLLVTVALDGPPHSRGLRVWHNGEVHTFDTMHDTNAGDTLGQLLTDANVESVNYRYREHDHPIVYRFRRVSHIGGEARALIPWGHVLNAIACLNYQSCEVPTWGESFANACLDAIRHKVCDRIASETDAPWEWSRETVKERENATRERLNNGKVA